MLVFIIKSFYQIVDGLVVDTRGLQETPSGEDGTSTDGLTDEIVLMRIQKLDRVS